MSEIQADGRTLKENLLNVQRQLKRTPKELEELVELPDCMAEYWHWFTRLSNRRPSGMGVSAIPYSEMRSFFDLLGIEPEPYEIEIIEMFDSVAIKHYQKQQEKERQKTIQQNKKK
jgi:hypothetical protein